MATKINSRTSSTTCNLYCAVENAEGTAVNVNISWSHNLSAPTVRENRHYAPDGSYTPAPSYQFDLFDSTFNNALKELVLDCFDNYSNINLIGEE